jgi:hypothetical protein
MKKVTGSVNASGSDGRLYTLYIYTDILDAGAFGEPAATREGLKELRTSNGLLVNRLRQGEYEIVQTGVRLHSDSPDAP